jgi:hypothetical protein
MVMRRTRHWVGIAAALALLVVAAPAVAAPTGNNISADFNRDGYADLAVGLPGQTIGFGVPTGSGAAQCSSSGERRPALPRTVRS